MARSLNEPVRGRIDFDGTRTPLKTALFLLVCLAWLLPGLVGHDPWKTDEAIVFGAVHEMLRSGEGVVLRVAGEPYLVRAPLYLWVSTLAAKAFGGVLAVHDAARLASGLFMAVTLALVSLASRELLGERAMRVSVLLLIGCLGLLIRAHEMSTDLAGLTGVALAVYGMALLGRRPRAGGAAAGVGMGIAFLGEGFVPLLLLVATFAVLPAINAAWRSRAYAESCLIAAMCAAPLVALWPALLAAASPTWVSLWLAHAVPPRLQSPLENWDWGELVYFVRILPWFAWPAWPLAAWSLWRARKTLKERKSIQLPLVLFVVFLVGLSLFADSSEVNALPLLLPLALLGVAELDSVPRGGASALDWFGMTTFFLFALLIWLGWIAVMTGHPEALLRWVAYEVPEFTYRFNFVSFALASLLTLIWLAVAARSMRSTRRAIVNWAAGITMVWMLAMTIGLPLIDQARSYRSVAGSLAKALPRDFKCVASNNLGDAQRALFAYFVGLNTVREELPGASRCGVLLVQAHAGRDLVTGPGWSEIWRGSRPGDRREVFILYRK